MPTTTPEIAGIAAKPLPRRTLVYFLCAVGLQGVLLFVGPAERAYTLATGKPVTLQTVPVDPYDPLRGYSVTLAYAFSRPERMPGYPFAAAEAGSPSGPGRARLREGERVYAVLAPVSGQQTWQAVRFEAEPPKRLAPGEVYLEGTVRAGRIRYGLERYYVPEEQIGALNADLGKQRGRALVDVRVDGRGRAIPVRLRLAGKTYAF
jgi:uncharacterized membrane-anchored protein